MSKITFLGTGHGFVFNLYNTCFVIENNNDYLLVDTGGSVDIVKRLKQHNISLLSLHHIFISHTHTDHIMGLFWIFKAMMGVMKNNMYKGYLNIYCNSEVATNIKTIMPCLLPKKGIELLNQYMIIHELEDGMHKDIIDLDIEFFDVLARGNMLYGFETCINNKKLIFLGDETCHEKLYPRLKDAHYVMHEAFCLDKEEHIFHPYDKNHSTVLSVCKAFADFNISNLILFHSEDTHENKKELYLQEGYSVYKGNIIVPDEHEEIEV